MTTNIQIHPLIHQRQVNYWKFASKRRAVFCVF